MPFITFWITHSHSVSESPGYMSFSILKIRPIKKYSSSYTFNVSCKLLGKGNALLSNRYPQSKFSFITSLEIFVIYTILTFWPLMTSGNSFKNNQLVWPTLLQKFSYYLGFLLHQLTPVQGYPNSHFAQFLVQIYSG